MIKYSVAVMESRDLVLDVHHLPPYLILKCPVRPTPDNDGLNERVRCFKRTLVEHAMKQHQGDYRSVSEELSVSKTEIYRLLGAKSR